MNLAESETQKGAASIVLTAPIQLPAPGSAIRQGDWKLIEWFEDDRLELYNLKRDIGEKNNLADKHPDIVKRLHSKLIIWRKEVDAKYPSPNPNAKTE